MLVDDAGRHLDGVPDTANDRGAGSDNPPTAAADAPYGNGIVPPGIRSRHIASVNGMTVHILEAGYETTGRPAVLLLTASPNSPTVGAR